MLHAWEPCNSQTQGVRQQNIVPHLPESLATPEKSGTMSCCLIPRVATAEHPQMPLKQAVTCFHHDAGNCPAWRRRLSLHAPCLWCITAVTDAFTSIGTPVPSAAVREAVTCMGEVSHQAIANFEVGLCLVRCKTCHACTCLCQYGKLAA